MQETKSKECNEVAERLAEILDGTAEERLLEHVASCDACRDARHDAERSRRIARDAALDYVVPPDLSERVERALSSPRAADAAVEGKPAFVQSKRAADAVPTPTAAPPAALAKEPAGEPEAATEPQPDPERQREPEPRREPGARAPEEAKKGDPRRAWLARGAVVALAAGLAMLARNATQPPTSAPKSSSWAGKVANVVAAAGGRGLESCDEAGKSCRSLVKGAALPASARVRTDGRTRAELVLDDGSVVSLDRDTELALLTTGVRHASLVRGALVADVAHQADEARFELPKGSVTVHGTKFSLRASGPRASVEVLRGSVTLANAEHDGVTVVEGETGRLEEGKPPSVAYTGTLGETLAWRDETFGEAERDVPERGLGELRAKKPGQDGERAGAVTLASHSVRVRIAGVMARTEVEEEFANQTDEVLEGIYRFPIPPDAQIERLALEVDGKWEEGAFVDRDRAAAIWRGAIVNAAPKQRRPVEEIVWVPGPWRDPALLEWQRGGRFELRIFPIPKHGKRRVILAYTEVVKPVGGTRRYTYPLPYDPSESTRIDRFDVNVEVRGNDAAFGVRPSGYTLDPSAADGTSKLAFSAERFAPSGDLTLEYALPNRQSELTAWSYLDSSPAPAKRTGGSGAATAPADVTDCSPYVALALRPKLPHAERGGTREVALVVDSSRSMLGEGFRRATDLAVRVARELDPDDRITVLACGTECRTLPGAPLAPGADAASAVRKFLGATTPEDGSDLVESIREGLRALGGRAGGERRVVYLGDGAPTVGEVRPGSVERAVRRRVGSGDATVTAVAIGAESDRAILEALSRGGGGVMLPYAPGQSLAQAAYAVLGQLYGNALTDVSITLPEGLGRVAPALPGAIPAGGEAFVVARMNNLELRGDVVLRGKVAGQPFEQRYPLELSASDARGNAFVPRLYAAARIADLERDGSDAAKKEAVALSSRFAVASRYTSLLVLESEAMFRAFGLDNAGPAARFTGEEEAEEGSADGLLDVGADDDASEASSGLASLGASGVGSFGPSGAASKASSGRAAEPLRSAPASAPRAAATAGPAPAPAAEKAADKKEARPVDRDALLVPDDPPPPRRRLVPMRKVWRRFGTVDANASTPKAASPSAIAEAEQALDRDPNRREALKRLFILTLQGGGAERALSLAERWSEKEPLDPEAITARADALAAGGDRARALRVLGSVIDVRPDDVAAQKRLARLERWRGRPALGCRHSIAIAELRPSDARLLAEAVRCARETGDGAAAGELMGNADAKTADAASKLLEQPAPDERALKGDLRVEASWSGGADVDLALIDPDGRRVSWLGAPTRGLISARDVTSMSSEGLALSGGKPGQYVVEVVRGGAGGRASGELTITVAGTTRRLPFTLDGPRVGVAIATIGVRSVLVPL